MIVLHPNSVCDVCFDPYGESNVPHSIRCGHVFCLRCRDPPRCLAQLSRQCCPLCRQTFGPEDVRRLLVDKTSQPGSPIRIDSSTAVSELSELPSPATSLRNRITRIVLDGGKASDVRDLIDEVRNWLSEQPPNEHPDLRAAYLLLFKYTDLQYKVKEEKAVIAELRQECEDLKEELRLEKEVADTKYQELSKKRMDEMETAMTVERNLRDRLDQTEREWKAKYHSCMEDCRRLKEELKRCKVNPLPTPRTVDAPFLFSPERDLPVPVPMDDDEVLVARPKTAERTKEDRFQLSPIPATATLPVSDLPNRQNFRPLTAEESDVEDFKSKRTSPYLLRSIDPIPIRPGLQRMSSSSSVTSRSGYRDDGGVPRSLPRSSVDVHMASCSSSPNAAFQYSPRERDEPMSGSIGAALDSSRGLTRRATVSSYAREHEEQQERARKLSDVLDRYDAAAAGPQTPPRATEKREHPVSPGSALSYSRPGQETGSRASTAALQAERARAMSLKDSSTHTSPSPVSPSATKDRDIASYQKLKEFDSGMHLLTCARNIGGRPGVYGSDLSLGLLFNLTRLLMILRFPAFIHGCRTSGMQGTIITAPIRVFGMLARIIIHSSIVRDNIQCKILPVDVEPGVRRYVQLMDACHGHEYNTLNVESPRCLETMYKDNGRNHAKIVVRRYFGKR
ncbi:hypothetical protein NM688_g3327 [Phlebia brevispora]|uniref:Uncharacterized protein n=1 Tax=Phlebia brevispora TaxID=194682 RepID=A0ACC1T6G7_9APHY|nr:hypothetical protein NM688_g3327 [Phlebia brevispora]